jgi:hypothetical protein
MSWFNRDPLDDPTTVGGKFANKTGTKPVRFFESWGPYPRWIAWVVLGLILTGLVLIVFF